MTLLPVVERELRVAARRGWTYWGRTLTAAFALAVASWFTAVAGNRGLTQLGTELFAVCSFLAFLFAAFAGNTFSSDTIAAERREGTLGLLFLTDLRGHDVALGKLSASSLGCVFCLLAALPVLALSLLAGGVTFSEYLRIVLVLLITLFFSLSAGLLASTFATDSKRAAGLATILTLVGGAGLPTLGGILWVVTDKLGITGSERDDLIARWFLWASPASAYTYAFDLQYRAHPVRFVAAVAYTGTIGLLYLAAASLRLPHIWQERSRSGTRPRLLRSLPGRSDHQRRSRLLAESPLVWIDRRHHLRVYGLWLYLGFCALVFFGLGLAFEKDWLDTPGYVATSLFLHVSLKTWVASEAPRQFHEDRRSGAMELLLSTPLSVSEFLDGRFLALRRRFLGPLAAILVVDILFLLYADSRTQSDSRNDWLVFWLARMVMLVLDSLALAWTGMWVGLRTRGSRTTGQVFARVLTLPWLVLVALLTVFGVLQISLMGSLFDKWGTKAFIGLWFLLGALADVFWILRSQSELTTRFREYAIQAPGVRQRTPAAPA